MLPSRHRKLVAVLAGVVLAGVPAAGLNYGLRAYVERQGHEDVSTAARRAITRAEMRIEQTLKALQTIQDSQIGSCSDLDVDQLRRVVMTTTPIKELSLTSDDGTIRCQHLGLAARSWALSKELSAGPSGVRLAVMRPLDFRERSLRIRWGRDAGALSIAAYVPADMFLSDTVSEPRDKAPIVRVQLSEGTVIAGSDPAGDPATESGQFITVRADSSRYPLVAFASIARATLFAEHADLIAIGALASGAVAILTLMLVVLVPWRGRANPIPDMERAIAANEFVPYYQPIVDIKSGKVVGAEVLARWRRRDGTVIPPGNFIPLAESSGLIVDITRALMRRVRDEAGEAIGRRPGVRVGFNLSARHFADEIVVADVQKIFGGSPLPLSQILLEVTERQPLEDLTTARRIIASLQGLGCRVAIDDVGTGHGGLSYMLKLGVDVIKIDKMFVDAIGTERYSTTIIETLVDLARNMRMEIIAEGVETFEQVSYLRDHGIEVAQGFVFAPPLPGPAFLQLLESVDPAGEQDAGDAAVAPGLERFGAARESVAA